MSQQLLLQRESANSISEDRVTHLNFPALILICGNNSNTSHFYGVLYGLLSHSSNNKKFIEEPNNMAPTAPIKYVVEFLILSCPFPFSNSFSEGSSSTRWQVCWVNLISSYRSNYLLFLQLLTLLMKQFRVQWLSLFICNWFCWLCTLLEY